jgi:hypothetical protein
MFDKKYYCNCGCGGNNCSMRHCDENCLRYNTQPPYRSLRQQIVEEGIYNSGYATGRREAYEELEKERTRLRNCTDQEKFVELLNTAMTPLDELRKNLKL